jgi:hypothetical protein
MVKTHIFLTGGLGNQLFQLAAGLSRENSQVVLDCKLGSPRVNDLDIPDILDFQLPEHVRPDYRPNKNLLIPKLSGLLLRRGVQLRDTASRKRLDKVIRSVLGAILYFRCESRVKVIQASDNGFFQMDPISQSEFFIGYFQSYRWTSIPNVEHQLKSLSLINPSPELLSFIRSNENTNSVMVHVRLGDYKEQENFGIPSIKYYESALNSVASSLEIDRILLFSNEPELALSYIPAKFHPLIVMVPSFGGSSAETLEAMRHAKNYIIGNSSLSWWGARLSYTKDSKVIAPNPWFVSAAEPTDLIQPDWIRIDAFHNLPH